jgi:hypothetical protein
LQDLDGPMASAIGFIRRSAASYLLMEWSGRAPYLTGEWRGEGTLEEHRHVQPIQWRGPIDTIPARWAVASAVGGVALDRPERRAQPRPGAIRWAVYAASVILTSFPLGPEGRCERPDSGESDVGSQAIETYDKMMLRLSLQHFRPDLWRDPWFMVVPHDNT